MRVIEEEFFQYGRSDWDEDYVKWGFHDRETQITEAESAVNMMPKRTPLRILDLACGLGTHAIHWSKLGHNVLAVDISETFVSKAREAANCAKADAVFEVADIRNLPYDGEFDAVTWIERSFFDEQVASSIAACLPDEGIFITDVRNPDHPRMKFRGSNWRTWKEANGVYHLESHETDESTGLRNSEWITIDTESGTLTKKTDSFKPLSQDDIQDILRNVGFKSTELRTMSGKLFTGGPEDCWLWLVATK